jgi:hypothetical protein
VKAYSYGHFAAAPPEKPLKPPSSIRVLKHSKGTRNKRR